ncbi:MAG: heme lyase NrfEFG subunit NrfE, partial [Candidatus Thioglobus sp.]
KRFALIGDAAVCGYLRWKKDRAGRVVDAMIHITFVVATITLIAYLSIENIYVILAIFLAAWIVLHSLLLLAQRLRQKGKISTSFIGMIVAHIGIAVFLFGATITTQYGVEKDIKMKVNETVEIKGNSFIFRGVERFSGANYTGNKGAIEVLRGKQKIAILKPEKRQYATGMPMTEAAINPSLLRDIYVALGEPLGDGAWSLRLYYKPLVRWIWLGGLLIAIGALLAAFDKRYRRKRRT